MRGWLLGVVMVIIAGAAGSCVSLSFDVRAAGWAAVVALTLSLMITPLRRWRAPVGPAWRRRWGLVAALWATVHLGWGMIAWGLPASLRILRDRPLAEAGGVAWLLLAFMALTTPVSMVQRLGVRRWRALHAGVFAAAVLVVLHLAWAPRAAPLAAPVVAVLWLLLIGMRLLRKPLT